MDKQVLDMMEQMDKLDTKMNGMQGQINRLDENMIKGFADVDTKLHGVKEVSLKIIAALNTVSKDSRYLKYKVSQIEEDVFHINPKQWWNDQQN